MEKIKIECIKELLSKLEYHFEIMECKNMTLNYSELSLLYDALSRLIELETQRILKENDHEETQLR